MKKNIVFILGLLAVGILAIGLLIAKNISAIKTFSDSVASLTKLQPNSDQVIFDTNVLNVFVEAVGQSGRGRFIDDALHV